MPSIGSRHSSKPSAAPRPRGSTTHTSRPHLPARRLALQKSLNPAGGTPTGGRIGTKRLRPRRRLDLRLSRANRSQHRPDGAARRGAPRAQSGAFDERPAAAGVLHEDRDDPSRRDVPHRRPHGRTRLGRGGERRRLGNGACHGARADSSTRPTSRPSVRSASSSGTTKRPA